MENQKSLVIFRFSAFLFKKGMNDMVNDGQVKATKSPFAMRQNEVKVLTEKKDMHQ